MFFLFVVLKKFQLPFLKNYDSPRIVENMMTGKTVNTVKVMPLAQEEGRRLLSLLIFFWLGNMLSP